MTIRVLRPADAPAYRALRLFALQDAPFAFSDSYEDEVRKTPEAYRDEIGFGFPWDAFVVGAFAADGTLSGYVRFRRDGRSKARHRAGLYGLYVGPTFRGRGLAWQLMDEGIRMAQAVPGLTQLQLWVLAPDGNPLVDLYTRLGFAAVGPVVPNDLLIDGRYVDALCMIRHLDAIDDPQNTKFAT
ncbi:MULTISPECIES: GNAT family N-acetyltransferase [unclassified Flavobacterium]|uniref:GNAT family N-acetyltransferase n=1 Tax=unclassified Flavobacterium TaxID=196869 RepID=UPI001F13719B|nr:MULTISPECIES: GNAT family N-acetyltransferase [unclassified Flavobacterium]UMY65097.1 GNAT family N-acetyltransferase [Flavobacterium sp. HJ-32-4]